MTDLSKVFDFVPHSLLIAKLEAYGFTIHVLALVFPYLENRKQNVRINSTNSNFKNIFSEAPQEPILGPSFFSLSLNNLFYSITTASV